MGSRCSDKITSYTQRWRNLKRKQKTQLFLRLGWRSSNRNNLKTAALLFIADGKHFEINEAFWKRWHHDNHVISLPESSSNTNVEFSNSSGVVWTENTMCFQSETSVFNQFFPARVDRALGEFEWPEDSWKAAARAQFNVLFKTIQYNFVMQCT